MEYAYLIYLSIIFCPTISPMATTYNDANFIQINYYLAALPHCYDSMV